MDRFKSLQKRNVIEPRKLVRWVHVLQYCFCHKRLLPGVYQTMLLFVAFPRPFRKYKLKVKEKRTARLPEEGPVY